MSARLIVAAAAGVIVGYVLQSPQAGFATFSAVYGLGAGLDPNSKAQGPRLEDLKAPQASPGAPLPFVQGAIRTAGFCAWASEKREIATTTEQGGKGAPGVDVTNYTYEVDILYVLAANEIAGVRRIWRNGELIWNIDADATPETLAASATTDAWRAIRVYTGSATQYPDPTYEAAVGIGNAPAYRGRGTVFIEGLQLLQGGQLPLLEFEVVTHAVPAEVDALTRLQSALNGTSEDESSYDNGSGVLNGGALTDTVYRVNRDNAAQPFTPSTLTYAGASGASFAPDGISPLTFECFLTWVQTPNVTFTTAASLLFANGTLHRIGYYADGGRMSYENSGFGIEWISDAPYSGKTHVALVFAASGTRVYVAGQMVWESTASGIPLAQALTVQLGDPYGYSSGTTHYTVDAFRVRFEEVYTGANFTPPADFPEPDLGSDTLAPENVPLGDVIERLCVRAGLAESDVDVSALAGLYMRGIAVPGGSTARSALDILRAAYFLEARESDKLYFVRRGSAPVVTLEWDELGASNDPMQPAEPLPLLRANDDEIPARFTVRFANAANDYQQGSESGDRVVTTSTAVQDVDLALSLLPSEAKTIAQVLAIDSHVALTTSEIVLTQQRAALEPADVILVPDNDGGLWRFRIVRIDESPGLRKLTLVRDEAAALQQLGTTDTSATGSSIVRPLGDTILEPLDIPILRDADNDAGYYVAAKGSVENWRGAVVFESLDDVTFQQAARVDEPAAMGTATTALGNWSGGWMFDEANTVSVDIGLGTLASYSRDAIINGTAPGALVGDEIIHWRAATLVSAGVYTLSGLLRGRRGTEWAQGGHAAGERFVVLQMAGLRRVVRDSGQLGVPYYLRGVTRGRSLDSADSELFTDTGVALKPFAPVDIRAARNGAGDVTLTWTRRTRLSTRLTGSAGINAPLGEATESYDVLIYASSAYAAVVRTISATSATATYLASEQSADGLTPGATLYVGVRQRSAVVGAGYEARKAA